MNIGMYYLPKVKYFFVVLDHKLFALGLLENNKVHSYVRHNTPFSVHKGNFGDIVILCTSLYRETPFSVQ